VRRLVVQCETRRHPYRDMSSDDVSKNLISVPALSTAAVDGSALISGFL
jgi:hypothetical protein